MRWADISSCGVVGRRLVGSRVDCGRADYPPPTFRSSRPSCGHNSFHLQVLQSSISCRLPNPTRLFHHPPTDKLTLTFLSVGAYQKFRHQHSILHNQRNQSHHLCKLPKVDVLTKESGAWGVRRASQASRETFWSSRSRSPGPDSPPFPPPGDDDVQSRH